MRQEHHIIAQQFSSHPVIQRLAGANLFDIQSGQNLMWLPADRQQATTDSLSPHTGGHLSSYYEGTERFLASQNDPSLSIQDVSNNLNRFTNDLTIGLATGQLLTNTPSGLSRDQANQQNEQFYYDKVGLNFRLNWVSPHSRPSIRMMFKSRGAYRPNLLFRRCRARRRSSRVTIRSRGAYRPNLLFRRCRARRRSIRITIRGCRALLRIP